jgi:hypothetical protein
LAESIFQLADKISWKEMDGLVIVVNTVSGNYYSLNKTASDIWQEVVAGKSVQEVHEGITKKYTVDEETLREDIKKCVEDWQKEGLIEQKT